MPASSVLRHFAFATLLIIGASLSPAAAQAPSCDRHSSLTPFALDTRSGRALLSVSAGDGRRGLIDLAGDAASGRLHAADERPVFAGSVGPGEPFGVERCGRECLQPVRWQEGRWSPLGEALTIPRRATVATTWDLSGSAWLVALEGDPATARAFRLVAREWQPMGQRPVLLDRPEAAYPDAADRQGVLFGGLRFSAGADPATTLSGLPRGAAGELLPAGGDDHRILLDERGRVFRSADAGRRWELSRWTPWGVQQTRTWEPGRDYQTVRPTGDGQGALALAWFDRRNRDQPRLYLTTWDSESGWRTLADLPPEISTLDGQVLAYDYLLRPTAERWLLLTGCVHTTASSQLSLRILDDGGELSGPRLVPLTKVR
ncbi:MAG: hypothetical protein AAF604_22130 [Acidobacteriota bacterium]